MDKFTFDTSRFIIMSKVKKGRFKVTYKKILFSSDEPASVDT